MRATDHKPAEMDAVDRDTLAGIELDAIRRHPRRAAEIRTAVADARRACAQAARLGYSSDMFEDLRDAVRRRFL